MTIARGIGATAVLGLVVAAAAIVGIQVAAAHSPISGNPRGAASAGAAGFRIAAAQSTLTWSDANATLVPIHGDLSYLVSAATAAKSITSGLKNVTTSVNAAGPATAALYSYSNSAYGQIHRDGSVTLSYVNVPVWNFTVPVTSLVDLSQPGVGARKPSNVSRTNCFFYYLVRATDGWFVTSGEECDVPTN